MFYDFAKLRPFLISTSLYITAFEMLKDAINKRIEEFFMVGHKCRNRNYQKDYDEEMRFYKEKHKDKKDKKTYASLDWLVNFGAITNADIKAYDEVREFRNKIAHELLDLTMGNLVENLDVMSNRFIVMLELLKKIETYWILNADIPCNPDFDGKEIKVEDVFSGPVLMLQMLCEEALGVKESLSK